MQSRNERCVIQLTVKDKGVGIYESELDKVFNLLWRSNSTDHQRLNPDGQGIGLYISQQICQSLGGDVELTSVQGQGCCVTITMQAQKRKIVAHDMSASCRIPQMKRSEGLVHFKGDSFNINVLTNDTGFCKGIDSNM